MLVRTLYSSSIINGLNPRQDWFIPVIRGLLIPLHICSGTNSLAKKCHPRRVAFIFNLLIQTCMKCTLVTCTNFTFILTDAISDMICFIKITPTGLVSVFIAWLSVSRQSFVQLARISKAVLKLDHRPLKLWKA